MSWKTVVVCLFVSFFASTTSTEGAVEAFRDERGNWVLVGRPEPRPPQVVRVVLKGDAW